MAIDDGCRILVDRLWPRGLRKADAHIDLWLKQVAPSSALRTWFGHRPERWAEFRDRYAVELDGSASALQPIREALHSRNVTLLYAAHDEVHNHANVLADYVRAHEG